MQVTERLQSALATQSLGSRNLASVEVRMRWGARAQANKEDVRKVEAAHGTL